MRLRRRRQRGPHHLRLLTADDDGCDGRPGLGTRAQQLTLRSPRVHRAIRDPCSGPPTRRRRPRLEPGELRRQRRCAPGHGLLADRAGRHGAPEDTADHRLPERDRRRSEAPRPNCTCSAITRVESMDDVRDLRRDQLRQHVGLPSVVHGRSQELPHDRHHVRRHSRASSGRQPHSQARNPRRQGRNRPMRSARNASASSAPSVRRIGHRSRGRASTRSQITKRFAALRTSYEAYDGRLTQLPGGTAHARCASNTASRSRSSAARSATSAAASTTCRCLPPRCGRTNRRQLDPSG